MSLSRDALQAQSVEPNTAWQKAIGRKETVVWLDQLPAGLLLDDRLDEPIWYDAPRKLLCYRGFMCHASYLLLHRRSDQREYLAALEELYLGSSVDTQRRGWFFWKLAVPLMLVAAAAAAWVWLRSGERQILWYRQRAWRLHRLQAR